jgi:hypothetical protein
LNLTQTTAYDFGYPGLSLGQAHICGEIKLVNGIQILL